MCGRSGSGSVIAVEYHDYQRLTRDRLERVYDRLLAVYGKQGWWPADKAIEMALGAILVQNTNWSNAQKALQNLRDHGLMDSSAIVECPLADLEKHLRPSGYFRQKAARTLIFCGWLEDRGGFSALGAMPTERLRKSLLDLHGIGPETADCILLYALGRAVFVVDAYTKRIFARLGLTHGFGPGRSEALRKALESTLEPDVEMFNEYHALLVAHGKTKCRTRPFCESCDLSSICDHYGGGDVTERRSGVR